jgi:hypothetical protein
MLVNTNMAVTMRQRYRSEQTQSLIVSTLAGAAAWRLYFLAWAAMPISPSSRPLATDVSALISFFGNRPNESVEVCFDHVPLFNMRNLTHRRGVSCSLRRAKT